MADSDKCLYDTSSSPRFSGHFGVYVLHRFKIIGTHSIVQNIMVFLHCFIPEHVPQNPFVSDTDSHAENKLTLSLFFMGGGGGAR